MLYYNHERRGTPKEFNMYKTYDPNGNKIIFNSLSEVRSFFELSKEDTHKVFISGCATVTAWGDTEITILHF